MITGRPAASDLRRLEHAVDPLLADLEERTTSGSANAELRAGAPAPFFSILSLVRLVGDAHCRYSHAACFFSDVREMPSPSPNIAECCALGPRGIDAVPDLADDARLRRILERGGEADAVEPHRGAAGARSWSGTRSS